MHIFHSALISTLFFAPVLVQGQEAPSSSAPVAPPSAQASAPAPSSLLQPALEEVEATLTSLKFDKWKKGSVRDEAGSNSNAILGDLKTKLPPLMAEADAAQGAISQSIPLVKHLDAVYDVLLRVEEASRISAPGDQIDQLEGALRKFEGARIALYDSLQQRAAGQEKQVTELQATIKAQQQAAEEEKKKPAPEAKAQPCTPPKAAPKKRHTAPRTTSPTDGKPAQNPPAQPKPQP